jgi:L-aspartate oxidase
MKSTWNSEPPTPETSTLSIPQQRLTCDYLVIGSGAAGLTAALKAAEIGSVLVITKKGASDCTSSWAQGGVSCVIDDEDSFESHVQDTLRAGAFLCKEDVVRHIVEAGPKRIQKLIDLGVQFTRRGDIEEGSSDGEAYDLGAEGGHSHRRILHAGDITGREIMRALIDACEKRAGITILDEHQAVDLISSRCLDWDGANRCLGAYVLDRRTSTVHTILSRFVILATGGAGKAYLYTSNPDVACGEGIAMAYRAYAEIANMEFFQFHPTCLYHPMAGSFLISEAVRGEGAVLKIKQGDEYVEFMENYDERASLAPRDIVARAIDRELKKSGQPCVYLDIRHHGEAFLKKRFPNIFAACESFGYNMATDLIPVVPAAHYCCGGVRNDINGVTCVENLYAIGEVGCTGLHGANRLASNSLLEALVLGNNAVEHSEKCFAEADVRHLNNGQRPVPDWNANDAADPDELIVVYHNWDEIRRFMWDYVGIFRTTKRLQRAKTRIRNIRKEIEHFYWDFTITADLIELRNMASVAEMIIDSALARQESIGLHYNHDFPVVDGKNSKKETILRRPGFQKELY